MRRHLPLFALALSACPRPEDKPRPAEVSVLAPSATGGAAEPASLDQRRGGEAVLLGRVNRLGTKLCKSFDQADWRDVHLRAGLVRLEGNVSELDGLRGEPVILFGSVVKDGKPDLPRDPGTCLPIQRRSDWIDGPDGLILEREEAPGIASFRVRAGRRFEHLTARVDGETLALELTNPLDVPLERAALLVHYEGCYGKPMTHTERLELGTLGPGAKKSASAPGTAAVTRGSRSGLAHHPVSVQVTGRAERVYFDLDVPLEKLGAALPCPKR